jgi:hypothetical protein
VRNAALSGLAFGLLLAVGLLLGTTPAHADGSFPEPRQILLPADRPAQIILATNFGLIFSEDDGKTWLFSCERGLSAYATPYALGAQAPHRIFALTNAGLIYSDDDSCSWQAARGTSSDLLLLAFALDPSNSQRVYTLAAPRFDLRNGISIYVSDDGGLGFGEPVFTSPPRSALLSIMVAPSQPSTLFAAMFSTPENHPLLLRSDDSGGHWEVVADLVESLGENPFELLAIDALDENRLHVRILGPFAETLATSDDGGLSFVQSVSIPGKLNAFLELASGTILVSGTAGPDAVGYRSKDGGKSFEAWPGAPHGHALAERSGKLYVAGDNFADGYAIAESDDEGAHLRPLAGFEQVQAVKSCAAEVCTESCTYYAGVGLWPKAVCGAESAPACADNPTVTEPDSAAGGGANATGGAADMPLETEPDTAAGGPSFDENGPRGALRISGGGCACDLGHGRRGNDWTALLVAGSMWVARRKARRTSRDPELLIQEQKGTGAGGGEDVGQTIVVDVGDHDLSSHARLRVEQVRLVTGRLPGLTDQPEPIQHGRCVQLSAQSVAMRAFALAGDDVLQTVTIHIRQVDRVQLGEGDTVFRFLGARVHQQMLHETCVRLLEPRQSPTVRLQTGDHVVVTIAVDVVGEHLRASIRFAGGFLTPESGGV